MEKSRVVRISVQTVGVCFGMLGLMWLYLGLHFVFTGIRDSDFFQLLYMTPMLLLFGGIVLAFAWQSVRHFGPKAIQNIVGLAAFGLYISLMSLTRPYQDAALELELRLHYAATFLIPLLIAYLLYRVLSRKLIEISKEDIQPEGERANSE